MIKDEHINRQGRKKGSLNKSTSIIRSQFQMLVENNIEKLQNDLDSMTPQQRFQAISNLAKFILPTLNSIDLVSATGDTFKPIEIHFNENTDK